MNKGEHRIHILTQACCNGDDLASYMKVYPELEIHFISLYHLTHALGPVYWQDQLKKVQTQFSSKNIYCWMEYCEAPGLAMGGLRLGVRHIVYKGQREHLEKIKSLANFYQGCVISSYQEI